MTIEITKNQFMGDHPALEEHLKEYITKVVHNIFES
jgi:hypothetical protein